MIEAKATALESISIECVKELVQAPGPCITLQLPPFHRGEKSRPSNVILRKILKELAADLEARRVPEPVRRDLIEPLDQLAEDSYLHAGSHFGSIIFRSPGLLRQFQLSPPVVPALAVSGSFHIRQALLEIQTPKHFHALKLSKRDVKLLGCSSVHATELPLPKGVPSTLDEAMAFKAPDHDLENRSFAGPSMGTMGGVRFGTGSGRETQHDYLIDFYKKVDRGLNGFWRSTELPLLLTGVAEDTNLYRALNTYHLLLPTNIPADQPFDEQAFLFKANKIIREAKIESETKALAEWRERLAPERYCNDLKKIIAAATEGRVDRLYIGGTDSAPGTFDTVLSKYRSFGEEDLLNLAAVQTIRHSGQVISLPVEGIPERAGVAAVFRY